MHDNESPDVGLTVPELTAFEATLASLVPQAQIDRDRLMFAAGSQAAGRRLRVINRVLAGTSLAFAGLACVALVSRGSEDPASNLKTSLASQKSDERHSHPSPTHPLSGDPSDESSVALAEGPTSQRLLREWVQNGQKFDRPVVQPSDERTTPRNASDATPPSTSRELLLRYLQSTSERL